MPLMRISVTVGVSIDDALGDRVLHRVREAERQVQGLALHLGAKADAYQLELALVALGDARHHVRQMRAGGSRLHAHGTQALVLHIQLLIGLLHGHSAGERQRQGSLRAFDRDEACA